MRLFKIRKPLTWQFTNEGSICQKPLNGPWLLPQQIYLCLMYFSNSQSYFSNNAECCGFSKNLLVTLTNYFPWSSLREKYANAEVFLVLIFLYLDWIRISADFKSLEKQPFLSERFITFVVVFSIYWKTGVSTVNGNISTGISSNGVASAI